MAESTATSKGRTTVPAQVESSAPTPGPACARSGASRCRRKPCRFLIGKAFDFADSLYTALAGESNQAPLFAFDKKSRSDSPARRSEKRRHAHELRGAAGPTLSIGPSRPEVTCLIMAFYDWLINDVRRERNRG